MKWSIPGIASALAILAAPAAPPAHAQMVTLHYHSIANGPTAAVSNWTCWFPDCRYAPCHMQTVQSPQLGVLRPSVHSGRIPESGGICAGRPITALTLTYTPRKGAHGTDFIILETHSDNGASHRLEVTVDVP